MELFNYKGNYDNSIQANSKDQEVNKLASFGEVEDSVNSGQSVDDAQHVSTLSIINSEYTGAKPSSVSSKIDMLNYTEEPARVDKDQPVESESERFTEIPRNHENLKRPGMRMPASVQRFEERDLVVDIKNAAKSFATFSKRLAATMLSNYQTWRIYKEFEKGSLVETTDFDFLLWKNQLMVYKYKGVDSDVVIPDYVGNVPVTSVYKGFLSKSIVNNHKLRGIGRYFSDHVDELSLDNLKSCAKGVRSVQLPVCLQAIPEYAFTGCSNLLFIEIPASVKIVAPNAFKNSKIFQIFFSGAAPENDHYLKLSKGSTLYCKPEFKTTFG